MNHIIDCKPFLSPSERDCCCKDKNPPAKPGEDDCLDIWEKEREAATRLLDEATADKSKANNIAGNASQWETKLKRWFENAEAIHKKAMKTHDELLLFIAHVETLEINAFKTAKTLKALLCLLKEIFDKICGLLQENEGKLAKLKDQIKCSTSIDEQKKRQALACVEEYEKKLRAISEELKANILNKTLELLHCANWIASVLGNPHQGKRDLGLKWQLNDLRKRLINEEETKAKGKVLACGCQHEEKPPFPCFKADISKDLLPIGPLQEGEKGSAYFEELKRLHLKAKTDATDFLEKEKEANKKFEEIAARKSSLEAAISAAKAAEAAK